MSTVLDYWDQPLHEGDRVSAWDNGREFKATVKSIGAALPGKQYRDIVLVQESDGRETRNFSDAVIVMGPEEVPEP